LAPDPLDDQVEVTRDGEVHLKQWPSEAQRLRSRQALLDLAKSRERVRKMARVLVRKASSMTFKDKIGARPHEQLDRCPIEAEQHSPVPIWVKRCLEEKSRPQISSGPEHRFVRGCAQLS
jgi:hypothetical protein